VEIKAVSFGLVGVANTLVDLSTFYIALKVLHLSALLVNIFSWCIAVSGSYLINFLTTVAAETGRRLTLRTYVRFIASGIAGLVAGTTALLVAAIFLNVWAAKLIAVALNFAVNFSLSHLVIFRQAKVSNSAS
jgi:putative flippase GtrA